MRVSLRALAGGVCALALAGAQGAWGANWTNGSGDSKWGTAANWDAGVPNGVDAVANFTLDISADTTVTLDGDKTVGSLVFNDSVASNNWVLSPGTPGTSRLILDVSTGSATINVANNSALPLNGAGQIPQLATINAVVAGNDGLTKTGLGTLVLTAANTLTGGVNVRAGGLTLDFSAAGAPAGNILAAANALTLGGGITAGGMSGGNLQLVGLGGATNSQTFASTSLGFGNNVINLNQNGASGLNLALGTLTRSTGSVVKFTLPTAGNITANVANANGILGGWATIGTGATATWAANDGTGNIVGYNAFTDVTGATPAIVSAPTSNVRLSGLTADVTFTAGTTDVNSILYTDNIARLLNVPSGSTLRLGATGGIFKSDLANVALTVGASGSTLTAGGAANTAGELTLTANAATGDQNGMVVNAAIKDNGTGAVTLVKAGTGALQLGAANTYTGGTYVNGGRLRLSGSGTLGTGAVYVANGGQIYFDHAATYANDMYISGKGFFEGGPAFSGGAIRTATNGTIMSGKITLLGDARITARSATGTGATYTGQITGGYGLEIGNTAATLGIITLANSANNWTGDTSIGSGTVKVGGTGEVIPNGAGFGNVIISGDTVVTTTNSVLDLNGKTETINGLNSGGDGSRAFVNSGVSGAATLRVGDNNANGNFAGNVQNGNAAAIVALTKIGSGVQTLSGNNTYTGLTTIENGTLRLGSSGGLPTGAKVVLGANATSGILDLGGSDATVSSIVTAGTGTANVVANSSTVGNSTLNFAGTGANTFAGRIQDTISGGTMKTGLAVTGGVLTLSGANTYTGDTNLIGGTLAVTGSLTTTGNVLVNTGAILAGTGDGTATGKVGNVILSGGGIRPGVNGTDGNVGSLTLNGLSAGSGDLRFDLTSTSVLDQIKVTGTADFSGGATISPSTAPAPGTYTLLTAGSLTGSAPTLNAPPAGTTRSTYGLNFDTTNNRIQLTVTGNAKSLTWTGANGSAWDVNQTVNWTDGTNPEKFFNLDSVTFGNGPTNRNVTLDVQVTPASVVVNNGAGNDYSISGSGGIGDTGFVGGTTLTKAGAGTLTLSTFNTYAGATSVQEGTLKVGSSGALPMATALVLGSGTTSGTVDLNGFDITVGSLATAGTGTANVIGNSGPSQQNINVTNASGTFGGVIRDGLASPSAGGQIGLNLSGGTLVLAGDNTYTGNTNVSQNATLQIGNGGAAGSLGNTNINVDGTLIFNRTGTLTVANSINGGGSVKQLGAGTTIFASDAGYGGDTTIAAGGTIQLGNGGTSGAINGGGNVIDSGVLAFNRGDDINPSNVISGSGAVEVRGTGTVTFSTAQTYSGGLTVKSGTVRLNVVGSAGTGTSTVNTGGTLVIGATGVTNPITLAGGTLGGTLPTTGTIPAFTSAAVTAAAGTNSTVYIADPQNPGTASEMILSGTLGGSGNFTVLAGVNNLNPDAGPGFRLRGTGASTFSGRITVGNGVKSELQTASAGPFSPMGSGTLVLTAGAIATGGDPTYSEVLLRNNFAGNTTIGNNLEIAGTGLANINPLGAGTANSVTTMGNLKIGNAQELGVNTNTTPGPVVVAFPTVTLNGGVASFSPKSQGLSFTGKGNLNLGAISELVPGSGIDMKGAGILTVTGTGSYTGGTTVESGTLTVSGSVAASSGVAVKATGTFNAAANQTVRGLSIDNGGVASVAAGKVLKVGDNTTVAPLVVDGTNGNTAKLDLTSGGLILDHSAAANASATLAAIRTQIIAGYNPSTPTAADGKWDGNGITSSTAATTAGRGVGYALSSEVAVNNAFMSTPVDTTAVVARYTLLGDATLDGSVDFNDLVKLAQNYNTTVSATTESWWNHGDFNYDGVTDFNDLVKLAQNYNTALPASGSIPGAPVGFEADLARAFASVPEPSTIGLIGVVAGGLLCRGRRRRAR